MNLIALSEGAVAPGVLDKVFEAGTKMVGFAGDLFVEIVNNPVLVVFVGAGLVGVGLKVFKKMKRTAC